MENYIYPFKKLLYQIYFGLFAKQDISYPRTDKLSISHNEMFIPHFTISPIAQPFCAFLVTKLLETPTPASPSYTRTRRLANEFWHNGHKQLGQFLVTLVNVTYLRSFVQPALLILKACWTHKSQKFWMNCYRSFALTISQHSSAAVRKKEEKELTVSEVNSGVKRSFNCMNNSDHHGN